jgi:hypothetical protein
MPAKACSGLRSELREQIDHDPDSERRFWKDHAQIEKIKAPCGFI